MVKDNPAGDEIVRTLPRQKRNVIHHPHQPQDEVGDTTLAMRESNASPAVKLLYEFTILTACRASDTRAAAWDEINIEEWVWIIPWEHTNTGRPCRIPLSTGVIAVLEKARSLNPDSELIFPSPRTGRALSPGVLTRLVRKLGIFGTVFDFRTTFLH